MTQSQVHILVVDDERNIRNNLAMVLEAEGYKVDKASNGDDALLQVKAGLYDIVFVDIQMPKMDGFALTRRLKTTPAVARIPVIILSSLASPEDKRRGLEAGADGYLVKGELGVESLALTIERLT